MAEEFDTEYRDRYKGKKYKGRLRLELLEL